MATIGIKLASPFVTTMVTRGEVTCLFKNPLEERNADLTELFIYFQSTGCDQIRPSMTSRGGT